MMVERKAVVGLIALIAYTEHWIRDTEAYDEACQAVGFEYRPGRGLFDATGTRVTVMRDGEEIPLR